MYFAIGKQDYASQDSHFATTPSYYTPRNKLMPSIILQFELCHWGTFLLVLQKRHLSSFSLGS